MKRGRSVLAISVVLALAGCTGTSADSDQPPPSSGTPSAVASDTHPAKPRAVPQHQRFTLDDTAQFDDGLQVEVAGTEATKATKTDRGADGTSGQIIIASVRIENDTREAYDARDVLIRATYGAGHDAPTIVDSSHELTSGFSGTVAVKDEAVATVGFAVPYAALGRVTITVDCNDDVHDPVSFSGRVRKS